MTVPFVDLRAQHEPLRDAFREAFERVVDTNSFILGEEVERFEADFAAYCGARECAGVASGTAALALALRAEGLRPGDEVIVPAHTFIATALAVLHAGATPVFCDVEEETGLIDFDAAAAVVTERTAAIVPVHLYGQVCDPEAVAAFARRHAVAVVEDAAQAHGASFGEDGVRAGASGFTAAYSFYPSKNLGALGDGGAVCTGNPDVAERVRQLRDLGQRGKGEHVIAGTNERLDGLQAAFLRAKLPHLDAWNAGRRRAAAWYRERLEREVPLLPDRPGSVYHLFPVRVADRDDVAAHLASAGVATGVHYSPMVPDQPPFARGGAGGEFPQAAAWAREELSLPMFETLTREQVERVAEALVRSRAARAAS